VSGVKPKNGNVRGSVIPGNGTDVGGSDRVDEIAREVQDDAAASVEQRQLGLENKSDIELISQNKGDGRPSDRPDKGNAIGGDDKDSEGKDYIVTFNNSKNPRIDSIKCDDVARAHKGTVGKKFSKVLDGCTMRLNPKEVNYIRKNANIQYIEEDQEVYASEESSAASWRLDRIDQCHLPLDGKMTKKDAGDVKVYILDTGIKGSHNDFDGVLEPSNASCHKDFTNEGNPLDDGKGHGTHVASTACGFTYGVAGNCELCAVKVLNRSGSGSMSGVILGIDHAVSNCDGSTKCVINMSLGGSKSTSLNMAVANAVNNGVHVVVAAGNENTDACIKSPASEPKAITVGSSTSTDTRSYFSNWGSCVDIFAPGSGIKAAWISSNTSTNTISGTSMASPHVAGIAAFIAGTGSFTPAQLTAQMKVMSKQGGVSDSQTSHGDLATDPCRHGGTIAIGHGYKVICKRNPPAGTNAFLYAGRIYHTANYASPVCPSTGADGIQGTLAPGNKACLIGTAPSGHRAWMYRNGWYYTDNVTGVCPYRPFPNSRYDGANCFIEKVPKGYVGFTADGNYYTHPKNFCSGHWYDGANCHVQVIPSGVNMRIESNAWVYDVCP